MPFWTVRGEGPTIRPFGWPPHPQIPFMPLHLRPLLIALGLSGCTSRQAAVGSPSPTTSSATSSAPARFTTITFERTPCFGTCPVYSVSVSVGASGAGTVTFRGERNVDSVGTFTATISPAAVDALGRAFEEARYFELESRYTHGEVNCRAEYATDASSIRTAITTPTRTKSIDHDLGCGNVPARLPELYRKFDSIVGTARWIGPR